MRPCESVLRPSGRAGDSPPARKLVAAEEGEISCSFYSCGMYAAQRHDSVPQGAGKHLLMHAVRPVFPCGFLPAQRFCSEAGGSRRVAVVRRALCRGRSVVMPVSCGRHWGGWAFGGHAALPPPRPRQPVCERIRPPFRIRKKGARYSGAPLSVFMASG